MNPRLWYPQLDVYDAIRRIAGLLVLWDKRCVPTPERLCIADFYVANPPLLHRTTMKANVRQRFNALDIVKPEKAFVSYPSPPLLFRKMDEVQRQAFRTLSGKGLIDLTRLENAEVAPSDEGYKIFRRKFLPLFGAKESEVATFIVSEFLVANDDIADLRRRTGLRRVVR